MFAKRLVAVSWRIVDSATEQKRTVFRRIGVFFDGKKKKKHFENLSRSSISCRRFTFLIVNGRLTFRAIPLDRDWQKAVHTGVEN